MTLDAKEYLNYFTCQRVASYQREAAEEFLKMGATIAMCTKADGTTITEKDKKVEEFLKKHLTGVFKGTGWIGEETTEQHERFCWITDPIDGTTNFGLGGEFWTISTALVDREEKKVLLGSVYQPRRRKTYLSWEEEDRPMLECHLHSAEGLKEVRSFLNPSRSQAFTELIITAYGPSRYMKESQNLQTRVRVAQIYEEMSVPNANRNYRILQGRRGSGCASLTLCRIAEGEEHGAILLFQSPWDIAAGVRIAKNAGCLLHTTLGGQVVYDGEDRTEEIIAKANKDTLVNVFCFANPDVERIVMEQFNKT